MLNLSRQLCYTFSVTIKQSDVVLLGYPLMMPMSQQIRRNDLEKYENVSRTVLPHRGLNMIILFNTLLC